MISVDKFFMSKKIQELYITSTSLLKTITRVRRGMFLYSIVIFLFLVGSFNFSYAQSPLSSEVSFDVDVDTVNATVKKRPFVALKTNLLYNWVLIPNIELEFPLGRHCSLGGEFLINRLQNRKNTIYTNILSLGLEGRFWLGNREKKKALTGWFLGLFTSAGLYDIQVMKTGGSQGEFLGGGISLGYGLPVAKNISFEFSAGVGYFIYDYRKYWVDYRVDIADGVTVEYSELVMEGLERRIQSIFPAKVKISFVWMLNSKHKKTKILWRD